MANTLRYRGCAAGTQRVAIVSRRRLRRRCRCVRGALREFHMGLATVTDGVVAGRRPWQFALAVDRAKVWMPKKQAPDEVTYLPLVVRLHTHPTAGRQKALPTERAVSLLRGSRGRVTVAAGLLGVTRRACGYGLGGGPPPCCSSRRRPAPPGSTGTWGWWRCASARP